MRCDRCGRGIEGTEKKNVGVKLCRPCYRVLSRAKTGRLPRSAALVGILAGALLLAQGCCVSKEELRADVTAWRSFTDAVEPDLQGAYGQLPEPSRSTRLKTLTDNRAAIAAATSRIGG